MEHVAIMNPAWKLTSKILSGEKTIESRWYKNKSTPWDRISTDDLVYFKEGKDIKVVAKVADVKQFENLDIAQVQEILDKFSKRIGISPENVPFYFELFKEKKYCILVFLKEVKSVTAFHINKTGFGMGTAWITLPSVSKIKL